MSVSKWAQDVLEGAMTEKTAAPAEGPIKLEDMLSTGCTLLNLGLSGHPLGGYVKGKFFLYTGDSGSGKTFLSMNCFAEACKNKNFDGYRLIYDNVEDGMLMNVEKLFGEKAADRIEPPALDENGEPKFSETIEDFYYNVDDAVNEEKPFIYILDSMDGLSSEAEEELFEKNKKAHAKGAKQSGSYGDGKAKKNSAGLRQLVSKIRKNGSILIILCQTRDVLNAMPFAENKTRAGGRALKFYATAEIWTSLGQAIKKDVKGKKRKIGDTVIIKLKKNRITGKLMTIETQILPSYGLDDIGSCIDYLLEEGWWSKKAGKITTKSEIGDGNRDTLITVIEDSKDNLRALRREALACWKHVEKQCSVERKPRYS